jgi:histidine triad (HIT) family protein
MPSLFTKIIQREIPAQIIYEDEHCLAFHDIHPQAPVHVLIIPKREIVRINEATAEDAALLGHLLTIAPHIAAQLKVATTGYRLVINNGPDAGESVPHLHIHLLAGRPLAWPPG